MNFRVFKFRKFGNIETNFRIAEFRKFRHIEMNFGIFKFRKFGNIEMNFRIAEFRKFRHIEMNFGIFKFRKFGNIEMNFRIAEFRKFRHIEMNFSCFISEHLIFRHVKAFRFGEIHTDRNRTVKSRFQLFRESFSLIHHQRDVFLNALCKILHHIGHPCIIVFQISFFRCRVMKHVIEHFSESCSRFMQRIYL